MTIEFLLRRRVATGAELPLALARRSLDRMADGGIRDQIGGGFHRYSVDAQWLVPHFEKMLYDNAQLARVYAHAHALTGDPRYAEVARSTLDYMIRELTTDDGAFAASQDADTEGQEGATFVWSLEEVREVLGAGATAFAEAYDVGPSGNWEGHTILRRVTPPGTAKAERALARSRERLHARRRERPQPARDDKALASWNGLAIAALADAGRTLGDDQYVRAAERAAAAVLAGLLGPDGRLGRSWKDGRASGTGVLEDYTHLADGLLALYEVTFDEPWFTAARALMDTVLARFEDPEGGFFNTADDHERLITRPKDIQDNAVPSGNAMAVTVLLRLAAWTGEGRYRDAAERAIAGVTTFAARYPTGFAQWLGAIDFALADVVEVAVVGDPRAEATRGLLEPVTTGYRPNQVVAAAADPAASAVPLMRDRVQIGGRPTAYLCRAFACRQPVTDAAALAEQLAAS
jgi:hypothetical protein